MKICLENFFKKPNLVTLVARSRRGVSDRDESKKGLLAYMRLPKMIIYCSYWEQ